MWKSAFMFMLLGRHKVCNGIREPDDVKKQTKEYQMRVITMLCSLMSKLLNRKGVCQKIDNGLLSRV